MRAAAQMLTVRVPLALRQRGGRKVIVSPTGDTIAANPPARNRVDSALIKALARAHRWNAMLTSGRYASISEIAAAEKIDRGYVGSILRLTLLAPDIVQAIMDGGQSSQLTLPRLLKPWPLEWKAQHEDLSKG